MLFTDLRPLCLRPAARDVAQADLGPEAGKTRKTGPLGLWDRPKRNTCVFGNSIFFSTHFCFFNTCLFLFGFYVFNTFGFCLFGYVRMLSLFAQKIVLGPCCLAEVNYPKSIQPAHMCTSTCRGNDGMQTKTNER